MSAPETQSSSYFLKLVELIVKRNPAAVAKLPGNIVFHIDPASWTVVNKGPQQGLRPGIIGEENVCFAMIASEGGVQDYLSGDNSRVDRAVASGDLTFHGPFEIFAKFFALLEGQSMLSVRAGAR